jgi:ABC-type cobalamin transport system ATPase subunit
MIEDIVAYLAPQGQTILVGRHKMNTTINAAHARFSSCLLEVGKATGNAG